MCNENWRETSILNHLRPEIYECRIYDIWLMSVGYICVCGWCTFDINALFGLLSGNINMCKYNIWQEKVANDIWNKSFKIKIKTWEVFKMDIFTKHACMNVFWNQINWINQQYLIKVLKITCFKQRSLMFSKEPSVQFSGQAKSDFLPRDLILSAPVSYTHLTLPTKA